MKSKFSIVAFILFLMIQSAPLVSGQENRVGLPGTARVVYQQKDKASGNECYVYARYTIKLSPVPEDNGEQIVVFERDETEAAADACSAEAAPYLTLPVGSQFFVGLAGDKIFVDSGTSAGERGLEIINLTTRQTVYSTSYYNEPKIVGDAFIYDKHSERKGTLNACQGWREWRKGGGGIGWVRTARLNLTTFKEIPVGKLKCVFLE